MNELINEYLNNTLYIVNIWWERNHKEVPGWWIAHTTPVARDRGRLFSVEEIDGHGRTNTAAYRDEMVTEGPI